MQQNGLIESHAGNLLENFKICGRNDLLKIENERATVGGKRAEEKKSNEMKKNEKKKEEPQAPQTCFRQ